MDFNPIAKLNRPANEEIHIHANVHRPIPRHVVNA